VNRFVFVSKLTHRYVFAVGFSFRTAGSSLVGFPSSPYRCVTDFAPSFHTSSRICNAEKRHAVPLEVQVVLRIHQRPTC